MHYFRDIKTWRRFLKGHAEVYFTTRKALRGLRRLAMGV
jgi:hypothetical protein